MHYWPEYVPVAERKKKAEKKIAALKKKGSSVSPIVINGRTIARTFWGKSWCTHLESYSDYENRLPRGRTYVRNGSVIDLQVKKGLIKALVNGSSLYTITIEIQPLDSTKWQTIINECAGKIDSLIELLQGKFSKAIMEIITNKDRGLFPHPNEIELDCSCPDYATMCKHVASTLYGIGARLDEEPEKLFLLRQVDHLDLISAAQSSKKFTTTGAKVLDESSLSSLFGIELDTAKTDAKITKAKTSSQKKPSQKKLQKPSSKIIPATKVVPTKKITQQKKQVSTKKKSVVKQKPTKTKVQKQKKEKTVVKQRYQKGMSSMS